MEKMILGYWDYHGFGLPIRTLLEIAGVDYEEKLYFPENKNEWLNEKKNLNVLFPNLPYLIDGEIKMTEHLAIMRYIARKYNLGPENEKETILIDQFESYACDISFGFYNTVYDTNNYEKSKKEYIEMMKDKLDWLNNFFQDRNYVVGKRLTYIDVYFYDFLILLNVFNDQLIKDKLNLLKFIDTMSELPAIKAYKNSNKWKTRNVCNSFSLFKGVY